MTERDGPDGRTGRVPPALAIGEGDFFVGRAPELAVALDAWRSCLAADTWAGVLIGGDAGAGKTRFAAEVVDRARPDGPVVVYGQCDEDLAVPYLAVVEAVGELLARRPAAVGPDLAPLLRPLPTAPAPQLAAGRDVDRLALFEALGSLLAATSAEAPVVVVLDDLQWADEPTIRLLRRLLRGRRAGRVFLLGTYRDDEMARHPELANLLADLRSEPTVARVRLGGLDVATSLEFVQTAAGHDLDRPAADLARELHARSGGNPFLMGQLLRHLVDAGAVYHEEGRWHVRGPVPDLPLPEGVREVVARRVSRLSPVCQDVLRAAAVAGPSFHFGVVDGLVPGAGTDAVLEALEEAVGAHLLHEHGWGTFAFAHGLVRDSLLADLGPTRRARLHRQVAEALETRSDAATNVEAVAAHYAAAVATAPAELAPKAARHGLAAGSVALARLAHEDAVVHLDRALAALDVAGAAEPALRAQLLLALGDARERGGDVAGMADAAGRAAEEATAAQRWDLVAAAALLLGTQAAVTIGRRNPLLERLCAQALAALDADDPLRVEVLAARARYLVAVGDAGDALDSARQALALARPSGRTDLVVAALGALGSALEATPDVDERRQVLDELVALSARGSDSRSAATVHYMRLRFLLEVGDREGLVAAVDDADRLGREQRSWGARAAAAAYRAGLALLDGRFAEVDRLAAAVLEHGGDDPDAFNSWSGLTAMLCREQGRLGDLALHFEREVRQQPGVVVYRSALALLHAEEGRLDVARRHLDVVAADDFAAVPHDPSRQAVLATTAEVVALVDDPDLAAALVPLLAPYRGLFVDLAGSGGCLGAADRFLGMLAATAGRFDEAERHFDAAAAMDERIGSPPLLTRTRYWQARMLARRGGPGDRATAARLADEARAVAARLGMAGVERAASALSGDCRQAAG